MLRKLFIVIALSIASYLSGVSDTIAAYQGDFTVSSYSQLFHSPGSISNSYGIAKELYTEFSELTVQTGNTYSILMHEASMQRALFDWPVNEDGEILMYNYYTNMFYTAQDSAAGAFIPGANNTIDVQADDGSLTLYFDSSTNAALLFMADEDGADYEEVGVGVIVRKSPGLSEADLNGKYIRYTIGDGNSGLTPRGRGNVDSLMMEQSTMHFDGTGNFTEQVEEWVSHRVITENIVTNGSDRYVDSYCIVPAPESGTYPANGTYSVDSANGTVVVTMPDASVTNQMSPDANLVVAALAEAGDDAAGGYLSVAVRQPTAMPTHAVDAVYFSAEINELFGSASPTAGNNSNRIELGRSYIFLRSDSTFFMRTDYWSVENTIENLRMNEPPNGLVSYNHFSTGSEPRTIELSRGSYSITTNGVVMLVFSDGEVGMAQLSANGQYVVYGFSEGEEGRGERCMGIGIKRDVPELFMEQVSFNPDFAITPTGGTFSVTVPTNSFVEILHKPDLTEREWSSFGATNAPDGNLRVNDPGALYNNTQFYTATFGIW